MRMIATLDKELTMSRKELIAALQTEQGDDQMVFIVCMDSMFKIDCLQFDLSHAPDEIHIRIEPEGEV